MTTSRDAPVENGGSGRLIGTAAVIWLLLVSGGYYYVHKPVTPAQALSLAGAAFQVLLAAGIVSVAGGVGLRLNGTRARMPLAAEMSAAALGLGLMSALYLVAGAVLGVTPLVSWVALGALGLAVRREVLAWWRGWRHLPGLTLQGGRTGLLIAGGAGLVVLVTLTVALAPPLKFDALVYHLTLPQEFVRLGRFGYLPGNVFWGMPQAAMVQYTWFLGLGGARPAVLGWLVALVALAGVLGAVASRFGPRAAWVACAALLSGYSLAVSLAWGYSDWHTFLFGAAFILALDAWRREQTTRAIVLSGLFAGFALGSKYTAGVLALAGPVVFFAHSRRPDRKWLASTGVFGIAVLAGFFPWGAQNWLATGNPFYPLVFPAGEMDPVRLDFYQVHPPWGEWWELVLLPLRATLVGSEGAPGYAADVGPLVLGLAGFAWAGWRSRAQEQRRLTGTAALVAVSGLLVWGIGGRLSSLLIQTRLYLALFPALALLAGAGFHALDNLRWPGVRLGRVVSALVFLVFGLTCLRLVIAGIRQGAGGVLLGVETEQRYLERNLGWYAPTMEAISQLPAGSKVAMLWEARSLYCSPVCEPDEVLDRWVHAARTTENPDRIVGEWQDQGFTHVLYYQTGAEFIKQDDPRYHPEEWTALQALLQSLDPREDFGGAYRLYRLAP